MIHLVLLSGGSGTRLWPLSNNARSKQFLKVLTNDKGEHISMVQRVFAQISAVQSEFDITIATCASQENSIRQQVDGSYTLVIEPERRDTAPAIMLACVNLLSCQGADANDTVVVLPIDTFTDQAYYNKVIDLDAAVQSDVAELILLGVEPDNPSEKFGYIVPRGDGELARQVERFVEKPSSSVAAELIDDGALWNCGVFAFKLGYVVNLAKERFAFSSYSDLVDHYSSLPKNSFDYEVVENAKSVAVISYSGLWKDLGTWNSLTEEMSEQYSGRIAVGDSCKNVHAINETNLPMVIAGLEDAVVIATPDGILASSKPASSNIKAAVNEVAGRRPMYERRLWGEYRVLDSGVYPGGAKSLSKELVVYSGKQLSYQKHAFRSEIWTVVAGEGEVVLDGEVSSVARGTVIDIKPGQMHAVRSIEDLHIIEVQLGEQLSEEDIERFGYYWND